MTDTATETRALIARVRATIAPADQPQALRDLARSADGEPRVDAGMLRQEAASLEAGDDATLADYVRVAGSWGARRIAIPIDVAAVALGENDRLRARVAELEEQVKEAVVRLARVPDMIDRERREGAEAMRERIAKHLDKRARQNAEAADRQQARADAFDSAADDVREMVLDDDAREDAGLVCGACGTPMSSSAADAVAYSGFPPAEGLSRPSCCDAAYPANAREDAQGDDNGR